MVSGNGGSERMFKQARAVLVLFLSLSLVFMNITPVFAASQADARTKMKHSPPEYFVSAHRIQLDVRVSDPKGVKLVRCYFRAAGETDFVFVPMSNTGKNSYSAVLPAPSATSERIEYLFLSVNAENVIVKSQTFGLGSKAADQVPAWQDIPMENEIKVSMELDQVPSELPGFSDNIAMDAVESGLRFGIVAGGLYQLSTAATASSAGSAAATSSAAAASTTGAAASAVSAGTVTAGAVGMSTAGLVGLGALGAVAVGGAAAAGGGGDSSDPVPPAPTPEPEPTPEPTPPPAPVDEITESNLAGEWVCMVYAPGLNTEEYFAYVTLNDNGTFSYVEYDEGVFDGSGTGTWSFDNESR